jgi:hypothetical protein
MYARVFPVMAFDRRVAARVRRRMAVTVAGARPMLVVEQATLASAVVWSRHVQLLVFRDPDLARGR